MAWAGTCRRSLCSRVDRPDLLATADVQHRRLRVCSVISGSLRSVRNASRARPGTWTFSVHRVRRGPRLRTPSSTRCVCEVQPDARCAGRSDDTAATMGVRQLMHSTLPVACWVVDGSIRVQKVDEVEERWWWTTASIVLMLLLVGPSVESRWHGDAAHHGIVAGGGRSGRRSALLAAALVAPQRSRSAPRPAGRGGPLAQYCAVGSDRLASSLRREQHRWAIGSSACGGALRVSSDALLFASVLDARALGAFIDGFVASLVRTARGDGGIGWPVFWAALAPLRGQGILHCGMAVFAPG